MPKLYFVFEQVSNGTSYTPIWNLKAIYDNVHYEIFCEELQDKARCAVDKAYAGNATALKEKILPRPIYPENLEQKLKQMKKQSNEYRLAGDFDAFISINHEIRQLNKLRKDKIAYERSVGNYERARKQAAAVNNKYKEAIIMEYNKLLDRFVVVSAFYQVEGAERQLQNIYENSAREEARVREAFKKQCVSVVTPVNKSYLVERAIVSRLFRTHEVFKFGARERLPAYPD